MNAVAPVNYALQRCAALRERRRLNREHQPSRAQAQQRDRGNSRMIVPRGVSERSFGSASALCVSRARGEELATRSSTGDGGTGGSCLGLGGDGATAALEGRPVGWLPFRGAASRARRTGFCAVLRGLVAGARCRGRPGRVWGSVGGLATLQGSVWLASFASGASFWSWYPWMGCLLLARPKFWVPGAFSAPQSAPLTQSSPRKLTSCSACSELDNH